jgi:hypothetical protein
MVQARDVMEVLDRDFLEMRSRVLALAAALDRAAGHRCDPPDRRLAQLRQAIEALLEPGPGRAETVQRMFSLDYNADWQKTFGLDRRGFGV